MQINEINGNIPSVEEVYAKQIESHGGSGNIKADAITAGHPGNPRKSAPFSIIDHKQSRDDKIDKRVFYNSSGLIYLEIHTTNHGNAKNHPFEKNGEHAHQIEWQDGKPKVGIGRELSDDERKDNSDIL